MIDGVGPLIPPERGDGVCGFDPPLDGIALCGREAAVHMLVETDMGDVEPFTAFTCLEHVPTAGLAFGEHLTDVHPVGEDCIGATPETTVWAYSPDDDSFGACRRITERSTTVSSFVGKRRSTEASIVLTSVEVAVQRLDVAGTPVGDEVDLGKLVVNKEGESVGLELPGDDQAQGAPGFKLIVREHGRDSRTTVTELRWPGAVVDPEDPEEPGALPGVPRDLLAADVTRTSAMLTWLPPEAGAPVHRYDIFVDGEPVGSVSGAPQFPVTMSDPGDELSHRLIQVRAVSNYNVASFPATIQVPVPPREPDPEPGDHPWPAVGSVGFMGNSQNLERIRAGQITTPGTVIENKLIDCTDSGELGIKAANVVLRNCVIQCGGWGVFLYNEEDAGRPTNGLIIEDCTFIGGYYAAVGLSQAEDWTIQRCDFMAGRDAIKPGGSGMIRDCTMRDPDTGGDAHNDCIQFSGDTNGVTIERCYLAGADTSCIAMFQEQGGDFHDVMIRENYLGGAGYAIYAGGRSGHDIAIQDNVFGPYGEDREHPVTLWQVKPGNVFEGNVYLDGSPVPVPAHED